MKYQLKEDSDSYLEVKRISNKTFVLIPSKVRKNKEEYTTIGGADRTEITKTFEWLYWVFKIYKNNRTR